LDRVRGAGRLSLGFRLRVAPFIQDSVLSPDGAPHKNGLRTHDTPAAMARALRLPYVGLAPTGLPALVPVRRM
jgi:hypothetical protein